jgi:hypothetical protein
MKSKDSTDLPPYLRLTEPLEAEAIPLQLSLITMEVAELRKALVRLGAVLEMAARMTKPPGAPPDA